jgi:2,4-dienoyl-CoA reductase-like NADH-dependent reductase (Old Yellow Enzyme family)
VSNVPDPFAPARLGPVDLRNRIIKAATFEGVMPDGLVTDELIEYHRRHAAGGVGMNTVAYLAVAPEGRTSTDCLWLRPEVAPGLRRLTDAIHAEGAAASAQIGHAGPVADARSNGVPSLAPSGSFSPVTMRRIRTVDEADLRRIREAYAAGAAMIVDAGFDAVEIHLGHNYLLSAFLSPRLNKRTDAYGGEIDNRARFPCEIVQTVRDTVGDRVAVTAKLNMRDGVKGGLEVDESLEFAARLESDGALDAIELTGGSSLMNPMYLFRGGVPFEEMAKTMKGVVRLGFRVVGKKMMPSYPYEEAFFLPLARQFRERLSMPLILLGGISQPATLDLAMTEGFEFVAMARALLREPDLIARWQAGADDAATCDHCNRCMPSIYSGTRCVTDFPDPIPVGSRR